MILFDFFPSLLVKIFAKHECLKNKYNKNKYNNNKYIALIPRVTELQI